jgi:GT2 family glycosyltransferase
MSTFAIVIPNLNQSHFLRSALESLKYQSAPFSLAVMDGGSTDDFREVMSEYLDIITFLSSGPDDGQAGAIREGMGKIEGDIVAWLNADDYYFPGTLDRVAACFEMDPELDVVYGDAVHVTPEGFFQSFFPAIQSFNARDLTRSCFICQPACFVRRSEYEVVGGVDPSLQYTMDWDLWCRLALSGARFQYIHEPLAAVRYYHGTKTLSRERLRYKEIWRIEKKYSHRLLPLSLAGFYRFDLFSKKNKTISEKTLLWILDLARKVKRDVLSVLGSRDELAGKIYGFQPWEPVVEGCCIIHLPWYDKHEWQKLYLSVDPLDNKYRIEINDEPCDYTLCDDGRLAVSVPHEIGAYRKISIENSGKNKWKLLEFSCKFELG